MQRCGSTVYTVGEEQSARTLLDRDESCHLDGMIYSRVSGYSGYTWKGGARRFIRVGRASQGELSASA